jgi:TonB-dependent starch-binding outer membrane protein SusC
MKCFLKVKRQKHTTKFLLIMKLTSVFLLAAALQVSAKGFSQQKINVEIKNAKITAILLNIEKESDYRFLYNNDLSALQQKASLTIHDASIKEVLDMLLQKTGLTYKLMENDLIVISDSTAADVQNIITGKVTGDNAAVLSGVSVLIKGTSKGTTTDVQGQYSINASSTDVLVFSYVGYEGQEISVGDKSEIDITLVLSKKELDQVVVVGYGTQRKIDVTGSVAHVSGTELVKEPVMTATQAIQGKVAGVEIISSGQPGSAPEVIIRGMGSILGGSNPLYVVDGIPLPPNDDITNINTADILSVDVLKDASSCAIYGARAANGVILITTRQGSGKMKVSYSVNMGISQAAFIVPMANSAEYLNYQQAITGLPVTATGYSTNWYNQVLRNAFYQNHNISISGGNDKDKYLFNVSYLDNEGIIIANSFNRYTLRFNNEFTPASYIKIGTTLSYANQTSQNVPTGTITEDAYRAAPTVPAILDGKYGNTSQYQNVGNPILDAYNTNDLSHDNKIQGNVYVEVKPIKSITLKSSFGGEIDFNDDRAYTYAHPNDTTFFTTNGGTQGATISNLAIAQTKFYDWSWDNTINYNQSFGKSKINILAGTTAEEYYATGITASREDVPPIQSEWYLQDGDPQFQFNGSSADKSARISYLGRVFYSYDDRYLLTATMRADASSVFSAANRWGYFPGISAGWIISKEKFMDNQHFFQYLKLRAGWGELGNSNIPSYASFLTTYTGTGSAYFFNSGNAGNTGGTLGTIEPTQPDQNLKWEVNKESDIGLEYSVLKGRLTGELDVYDKRTDNALIPVYVPGSFGQQANPNGSAFSPGYILTNAASIDNKGLEFSAKWHGDINKNLSFSIGGNVSFNKNRVLNLNGGSPIFDGNINGYDVTETKAGYAIGSFFVRQVIGVFQNQEQIDNYKSASGVELQSGAQPGDFIYKYNANGSLDTAYGGSYQPVAYVGISGSLNYKNFDFSLDIYSNIGNQVYNGKAQARVVETDNVEASVANSFWTMQNASETQPRANGGNLPASTYFISSGTFARINNIAVGYTLPSRILGKQKIISSCRIFVNAQNPVTLKKYSGFSSELPGGPTNSGIELNTYPTVKTFAVGLNVGF